MQNITITNPTNFEEIKNNIISKGKENLHILADFDGTLTKVNINGQKAPSLISVLRDEKYLTADYPAKAHALYEKYSRMENDSKLTLEQRKMAMEEWWKTHFDLLFESGLNKNDLEKILQSDRIQLRDGVLEMLNLLKEKNIPLVIISASGIGDIISMVLKKNNILFDNIYIITNTFVWDQGGKATGTQGPIIHSLKKDETSLVDFPNIFTKIKDRKNVILLGDGLGDVGMIDGFDYDNLLKIGFQNEQDQEKTKIFEKYFDVVVENDGSVELINEIIKNINN